MKCTVRIEGPVAIVVAFCGSRFTIEPPRNEAVCNGQLLDGAVTWKGKEDSWIEVSLDPERLTLVNPQHWLVPAIEPTGSPRRQSK